MSQETVVFMNTEERTLNFADFTLIACFFHDKRGIVEFRPSTCSSINVSIN
jgi:hypothetical protein